MATLLLVVIYIAFIGLGIPDSLFGTAWPAIYTEYGLPISLGGVITTIASIGAQMAVANIAVLTSPLLFGFLGQVFGMTLFGYYLLFFYGFLLVGVILNVRQFRKR
ncbi:MAG: hypothetical protein J6Y08_02300 [Clostridiales bacterium]|nr:hypothetical protein [Clostridiales bacterium]